MANGWDHDLDTEAGPYHLSWQCPECSHIHKSEKADFWEELTSAGLGLAFVQCKDCGQEFEVEAQGNFAWTAYGEDIKFTSLGKSE